MRATAAAPDAPSLQFPLRTTLHGGAQQPPCAAWAGVLAEALSPEGFCDLPEEGLFAAFGAAQRLSAWVAWLQVQAIGEAARRALDPAWVTAGLGVGDPEADARIRESALSHAELYGLRDLVAHLALESGMSECAVSQRLDAALAIRPDRLALTGPLFEAGLLDWPKVHAIVTVTDSLEDAGAAAVEAAVLGKHRVWSNTPGLSRALTRAKAAWEAAWEATREREADDKTDDTADDAERGGGDRRGQHAGPSALDDRRVSCSLPDLGTPLNERALGGLWARIPAADLMMIDGVLDELARAAKTADDTRTHEQRRADAFVGVFTNIGAALWRTSPARRPAVVVTLTLGTALGLEEQPGDLAGFGPIPAAAAREVASGGDWRCAVLDDVHGTLLGLGRSTFTPTYAPGSGLDRFTRLRDQTCTFPGCHSRVTDLDHIVKHREGGPTCECNAARLCRRHHRLKDAGCFSLAVSTDPDDPPGTFMWTTRHGLVHKRNPQVLDPPWLPRVRPNTQASAADDWPRPGREPAVPVVGVRAPTGGSRGSDVPAPF